jgi:hypothetical protein
MPLNPNAAMGLANAKPLLFPLPKFLAQVVTALRYIKVVAKPIITKEKAMTDNGQPL